jgi:hypothetical protein
VNQFLELIGRVMNIIGIPGFVRDTEYRSCTCETTVRVKRGLFFTVISVNGLDVYFSRFTGSIDGVGFSPRSDCKTDVTPESMRSGELRVEMRRLARSRS